MARTDAATREHLRRAADRAADDPIIAAEPAAPDTMAQDRHVGTSRRQFLCGKAAAERRAQGERSERIGEGETGEDALGPVAARDVAVAKVERREVLNRLADVKVEKFCG